MADSHTIGNRIDPIRYVFSGSALADAQRIGVAARGAASRAEVAADAEASGTRFSPTSELDDGEQRAVDALRKTDRRVRQHEQAHIAVGGNLILGGPSFAFETGPDGKRYAVSGEVSIDTSPGRTPEETVPKARHIRAAALAPADPSPQDRAVAAAASSMEAKAAVELAVKAQQERSGAVDGGGLYRRVAEYDAGATQALGTTVSDFA